MKYKYSLLGMAAGTALLLAGCGKSEAPTTTASDDTSKSAAPAVVEKQPEAQTPKVAESQPTAPAKLEPVTPAPAATPAVAQTQPTAANQPVAATTPAASPATTTLQSAFQAQKVSFTQTATNQLQTLAAAATNRVLSALGTTNQVAGTVTNQVQALLERAKALSANQKYQEALATVSQLYETKLTPEQKLQADALKNQIQAALTEKAAAGASSVLGNILGGKK